MELRDYLRVLARRRHIVAIVFAATVAVAIALTLLQPAKWTATTTLRVEPSTSLVGGSVQVDDVKYLDRLVNTYSRLATSRAMSERVGREIGTKTAPRVEVRQLPNTNLVELSATTTDSAAAVPATKRVASLLISQLETLATADQATAEKSFERRTTRLEKEKARAEAELHALRATDGSERVLLLREQINGMSQRLAALRDDHERFQSNREANERAVTVIADPAVPTTPDNRNVRLAIVLGLLFAAIAGPGLAFATENLSSRFRTRDEIEASVEAPVLSAIPIVNGITGRTLFNSGSQGEEAFRRLRTTLMLQSHDDPRISDGGRTILVTSTYPREGKSTVVANLGRSLAESGRPTLLIDADLHRPVLHEFFGIQSASGLSDILRGALPSASEWSKLFRSTGVEGLALLPAGPPVEDTTTVLGSSWASSGVFVELADRYDYVLIDSPAVLTVPDALAITRNVDSVLLVAGSNIEPDALRYAHQQLTRVGAEVLGVVINGAGDPGLYPYVEYGPRAERGAPVAR